MKKLNIDIEDLFTYHPPTADQVARYKAINDAAKNLAQVIVDNCPASADATDAIRSVRNARMTANASIALEKGEE